MTAQRRFKAIGLMSGTSMDGIDVAYLETDGDAQLDIGPHTGVPYPAELRRVLLTLPAPDADVLRLERDVTDLQSQAVREFCAAEKIDLRAVDVIGFHGQTIKHDPLQRKTWQLGDGQRMANLLGVTVVNRFRQNDMDHGGQGAPFAPAYHRVIVRAKGLSRPVAVLNIGGVSNVTLIDGDTLYACDCGPGNALIDDWVSARCAVPYDEGGRIAASGRVDEAVLSELLRAPYFRQSGPKSLDRNAFSSEAAALLSPADGAATLSAFTAAAIVEEARRLSCQPSEWIVVGGGRLNHCLLTQLRRRLGVSVKTAEDFGWAGDAIEAQAFAYLAVRSLLKLPLSWPTTTGVAEAVTGGVRWDPSPVRAVLFDLDGTLLDTAPDMVGALNELCAEEQLNALPYEDVRPHVSHGALALVRLAFPAADDQVIAKMRARYLELYGRRVAAETRPYDGILTALSRLEAKGIVWGIVTNKHHWLTAPLLEKLNLRDRAKVVVSGDTLRQQKPHPAPLLHAANELGVEPSKCIYIGDAERDVLAAQAAGMKVYVALFGYIPANERPREWPASGWLETAHALAALLDSI